jgi:hypothetical protein
MNGLHCNRVTESFGAQLKLRLLSPAHKYESRHSETTHTPLQRIEPNVCKAEGSAYASYSYSRSSTVTHIWILRLVPRHAKLSNKSIQAISTYHSVELEWFLLAGTPFPLPRRHDVVDLQEAGRVSRGKATPEVAPRMMKWGQVEAPTACLVQRWPDSRRCGRYRIG